MEYPATDACAKIDEIPMSVIIRPAMPDDCKQLAAVHCAELSDDVLPQLGVRFAAERFYPGLLESTDASVHVVGNRSDVHGFVIVESVPGAVTKAMRQNIASFVITILMAVLRRPHLALDIMCATLFKRVVLNHTLAKADAVTEISFIAVSRDHQGAGLGAKLVEAAARVARAHSQPLIVRTASDQAERFYAACGFTAIGHEQRCRRLLSILLMQDGPGARTFHKVAETKG